MSDSEPKDPANPSEPVMSKPYIMPDDPEPASAEALAKEAAEARDKMLRTLAEMENLRKRNAQEIGNARDFAAKDFAFSLLAVKDTLEMVLKGTGRTWQAPSVHGQRSPVSVLGLRAVHLTASFLLLVRSATAAPMPTPLTRCTGWRAIRCPVSRSIPIFRSPSI